MEEVFVTVGIRKLNGIIIGEENGKYIVELQDKSKVIVTENQIEKR